MRRETRYDSRRVRLHTGEIERADGRYEFRYSLFGKRFSVYADTLSELREKEAKIVPEPAKMFTEYKSKRITVNDLYLLWKELKRGIRERTFCNYCYCYEAYVKDSIGREYVAALKKSDVKRFFNSLADERRLKIGTIDNVHTVLHQVLELAVDDGLIAKNPSDEAIKELMRSRNMHAEHRVVLTLPEQTLLMTFLEETTAYSRWKPIITVLLETGLRVGEITGLRWCDVDLSEGVIDVNHTLVYFDKTQLKNQKGCGYGINNTKTPASKRRIPMTKAVKHAFEEERNYQLWAGVECVSEVEGYTDFVFLNRFGNVMNQASINKVLKRIIRDCNDREFLKSDSPEVLLPNFTCHSLRHTFATRMLEAGVNVRLLQDLMGHADVATTINTYTHVTKELSREGIDELETYMHQGNIK